MDDAQKQLDERLAGLTEEDEAYWYNEEWWDRMSWDFGKTQEQKDKIIEVPSLKRRILTVIAKSKDFSRIGHIFRPISYFEELP